MNHLKLTYSNGEQLLFEKESVIELNIIKEDTDINIVENTINSRVLNFNLLLSNTSKATYITNSKEILSYSEWKEIIQRKDLMDIEISLINDGFETKKSWYNPLFDNVNEEDTSLNFTEENCFITLQKHWQHYLFHALEKRTIQIKESFPNDQFLFEVVNNGITDEIVFFHTNVNKDMKLSKKVKLQIYYLIRNVLDEFNENIKFHILEGNDNVKNYIKWEKPIVI